MGRPIRRAEPLPAYETLAKTEQSGSLAGGSSIIEGGGGNDWEGPPPGAYQLNLTSWRDNQYCLPRAHWRGDNNAVLQISWSSKCVVHCSSSEMIWLNLSHQESNTNPYCLSYTFVAVPLIYILKHSVRLWAPREQKCLNKQHCHLPLEALVGLEMHSINVW